jgi:hypothetical protein
MLTLTLMKATKLPPHTILTTIVGEVSMETASVHMKMRATPLGFCKMKLKLKLKLTLLLW